MTETLREVDWPEAGRFVILDHQLPATDARPSHWDLMLETPAGLVTFEAMQFQAGQEVVRLRRLPNHRVAYLDYEGPISNNRGCVRRVDRGHYEVTAVDNATVTLELRGGRFVGTARLQPTFPKPLESGTEQGRAGTRNDENQPAFGQESRQGSVSGDNRGRTSPPSDASDLDRNGSHGHRSSNEAPYRMAADDRYTRSPLATSVTAPGETVTGETVTGETVTGETVTGETVTGEAPISKVDAPLGPLPSRSAANHSELGSSIETSRPALNGPEDHGGPHDVSRNPLPPVHQWWIMDATGLNQSPH